MFVQTAVLGLGDRIGCLVGLPALPGHFHTTISDSQVIKAIINHGRILIRVLQAEITTKTHEQLAGLFRVELQSGRRVIDLAISLQPELQFTRSALLDRVHQRNIKHLIAILAADKWFSGLFDLYLNAASFPGQQNIVTVVDDHGAITRRGQFDTEIDLLATDSGV